MKANKRIRDLDRIRKGPPIGVICIDGCLRPTTTFTQWGKRLYRKVTNGATGGGKLTIIGGTVKIGQKKADHVAESPTGRISVSGPVLQGLPVPKIGAPTPHKRTVRNGLKLAFKKVQKIFGGSQRGS